MLQTTSSPIPSSAAGRPVHVLRRFAAYAVYLAVLLGLALAAICFAPDFGIAILHCSLLLVVGAVQPALAFRRSLIRIAVVGLIGASVMFLGAWIATVRQIPIDGTSPGWMTTLLVFVATTMAVALASLSATRVWKEFPTLFSGWLP